MTEKPRLDGLLVLSYFFPPMSNGPALVLSTLLAALDTTGSVVFAGNPDRYADHREVGPCIDAQVRRFDVPAWWPLQDRPRLRLRAIGNLLVSLRVAVAAVRELRRPDRRAVLAVYPKQHFLLAGCLASFITRKPLVVYFMDVYVEGLPRGRVVARLIERFLARQARAVLAMSSPHRDHIAARFPGVPVFEVPHPYAPSEVGAEVELAGDPAIVFTGAVYDAQADAIRRLIESFEQPPLRDLDPRLHLYSQHGVSELAQWGIRPSSRVVMRSVSRSEARAAQRSADILFLPMAFDGNPFVTRTASPGKLPEYLASGRPVLVHAPVDSYIARYGRETGFAEVVDVPSAAALADAVARLHADPARGAEVVAAAGQALRRHVAPVGAAVLADAVNLARRHDA